jgi:hypothetical protein
MVLKRVFSMAQDHKSRDPWFTTINDYGSKSRVLPGPWSKTIKDGFGSPKKFYIEEKPRK